MPAKSTAEKLPIPLLPDALQEGFDFFTGRWSGDDALDHAQAARIVFKAQGLKAGLFEGTTDSWRGNVKTAKSYYRVFFHHPSDPLYYAWFNPGKKDDWHTLFDSKLATWFEFAQETAK